MYGWIETGGFFAHTTEQDIVFRSTTSHQYIAIGNSSSNDELAGVYITSNQVGIHCLPFDSNNTFSVHGDSIFYDSIVTFQDSNTQININGTQIDFKDGLIHDTNAKSTMYLDTYDSRIRTDSAVLENILASKNVIHNVTVVDVQSVEIRENIDDPIIYGHDVTIDATHQEHFMDGTVFVVNRRTYYVWLVSQSAPNLITLRISSYSRHAPVGSIVFGVNDIIDIEVLEDWSPVNVAAKLETLYYRFSVDRYAFSNITYSPNDIITNGEIEIMFYFRNKTHILREQLDIGSLHVLASSINATKTSPPVVLKLISIDDTYVATNGQNGFRMKFRSADSMMDLDAGGLGNMLSSALPGVIKTVFMLPLTHIKTPEVNDSAIVGYTIDTISGRLSYQLVDANLATFSSSYGTAQLFNYGVENIILGSRESKNVAKYYKPGPSDTVVIDTFGVNDDIFTVMRQDVSYTLKGIPLVVESVTRISDVVAEFELSSSFELTNIQTYEGHYLYWIDNGLPNGFVMQCNRAREDVMSGHYQFMVSDTSTVSNILDDGAAYFYEPGRVVYIIPFKYTNHVRVGDFTHNVYLPYSMSIGTYKARELLTVKGEASCVGNINLYNHLNDQLRENKFTISYNNSRVLNLNDDVKISPDNVLVLKPLEVNGTVTAVDYIKYSDARLKTEIEDTSEESDLHRLLNVDVKTFKLRGAKKRSTGIIAQDIIKTYPEAISKTIDIVPGATQIAYVEFSANRLRIHAFDNTTYGIKQGSVIRLLPMNECAWQHIDVNVIEIGTDSEYSDDDRTFLYIEMNQLLRSSTFVRIVGIVEELLLVNYEVLYMSAINAIKCIKKEMDEIKEFIGV